MCGANSRMELEELRGRVLQRLGSEDQSFMKAGHLNLFNVNLILGRNDLLAEQWQLSLKESAATLDVLTRDAQTSDEQTILVNSLLDVFWSEIVDFVDRLQDILKLFGLSMDEHLVHSYRKFWFPIHAAQLLIPNIKYSINVAFCRHVNQEFPAPCKLPFGLHLFPKTLRKALGRLRSDDRRWKGSSLYLINSLFQGWKKSLLPLDRISFDRNMCKHKTFLTERSVEMSDETLDDIHRITNQILQGFRYNPNQSAGLLPSTSATVEYPARQGALGGLRDYHYDRHLRNGCNTDSSVYLDWVLDRDFCSTLVGFASDCYKVKELRGFGPDGIEMKQIERRIIRSTFDNNCFVLPYGVLEPLKVRTITRPTWWTHLGMRALQKQLLAHLNKFQTFCITGDSNREKLKELLQPLVDSDLLNEQNLNKFVSGDYSSATDLLNVEVTETIFNAICTVGKVPMWLQHRGLKSLTKANIIYSSKIMPSMSQLSPFRYYEPKSVDEEGISREQTNGQLMGHILSFPILCIANYCAYQISWERRFQRQLSFQTLERNIPVRVNGDDILFRTDDEHYPIWKETVAEFGFELSVGKNFISDEFFQINSQMFRISWKHGLPDFQLIKYFNFGLLHGRKKGDDSEKSMRMYPSYVAEKKERLQLIDQNQDIVSTISSRFSDYLKLYEDTPEKVRPLCAEMIRDQFKNKYTGLLSKKQLEVVLTMPLKYGGLNFAPDGSEDLRHFYNNVQSQLHGLFKCRTDPMDLTKALMPSHFPFGKFYIQRDYKAVEPKRYHIFRLPKQEKEFRVDYHGEYSFSMDDIFV